MLLSWSIECHNRSNEMQHVSTTEAVKLFVSRIIKATGKVCERMTLSEVVWNTLHVCFRIFEQHSHSQLVDTHPLFTKTINTSNK